MNVREQFPAQLVEDAKNDQIAFGKLYDYFFPRVFAFVCSKVGNRGVAEDLTSDAFVKILENLHKYVDRGLPFAAWVFAIARNIIFDYYAKSNKLQQTDLAEGMEIKDEKDDNAPVKEAIKNELKEKVAQVMKKLPEKELTVLQMRFFAGLNNREIAATLDLSESNVGIILYRVLRKLKPDLNNLF